MNFVRIVGAQSAERFADIIKDPVALCMSRAPANEQRSGRSRSEHCQVRLCEWREPNGRIERRARTERRI